MKLIVGLGNPGEKYQHNRHNVGFVVVDSLIMNSEFRIKNENIKFEFSKKFEAEMVQVGDIILAKPTTFMNESGRAVSAIMRFYKLKCEDLYVIHDDLDITLGNYKIQFGKGPQIHNGLRSIEEKLGTDQFWNVRVGVENREVRGNKGVPGVVYSLQDFNKEEQRIIDDLVANVSKELSNIIAKVPNTR